MFSFRAAVRETHTEIMPGDVPTASSSEPYATLTFTSYTPRWLPQAPHRASAASRTLLDHVVGAAQDDGEGIKHSPLSQLKSLGYDVLSTPSGVAWWSEVSPSGSAALRGAPPATDFNRLLGLEQGS